VRHRIGDRADRSRGPGERGPGRARAEPGRGNAGRVGSRAQSARADHTSHPSHRHGEQFGLRAESAEIRERSELLRDAHRPRPPFGSHINTIRPTQRDQPHPPRPTSHSSHAHTKQFGSPPRIRGAIRTTVSFPQLRGTGRGRRGGADRLAGWSSAGLTGRDAEARSNGAAAGRAVFEHRRGRYRIDANGPQLGPSPRIGADRDAHDDDSGPRDLRLCRSGADPALGPFRLSDPSARLLERLF
jgi:hypothetical protein